MVEAFAKPVKTGRRRKLVQGGIGLVLLALAVWAAWFFTSGGFHDSVRRRVIARIEQITGGRVELRSLTWNLSKLEFEATDLTIHGLESPNEVPYAHADRVYLRLQVRSLVTRDIALRRLDLSRPIVHIIVYPDGSTNQPAPKSRRPSGRDPIEQLFELGVDRASASDGMLIWNQRRIPLDFAANDIASTLSYVNSEKRYDGTLHIGKFDTTIEDLRPFASSADASFSLYRDRANITALKWASSKSHLEGTGVITNFADPHLQLDYRASVSLSETGSIARIRELRSGTLDATGQGTLTEMSFETAGRVQIKALELDGGAMHVRDGYATADFTLTREDLGLKNIFARILGGSAHGEAKVIRWLASSGAQQRQGSANLKIDSLSTAQIANAFSTRKLPLADLNLAGTTSGTVNARWTGNGADAEAALALDFSPPPSPSATDNPVTGSLHGSFNLRTQSLQVADASLQTRSTHVVASGAMGAKQANLRLTIDSGNVGEFRPLINALRPEPLPVDFGGSLAFTGTAAGRFSAPTIIGHVDVRDFTTIYTAPPEAATAPIAPTTPTRVHWDQLVGDIRYSPTQAAINHATLHRGNSVMTLDASAALTKGSFTSTSPLSARLNVSNADAADILSLAGYAYPVLGRVDAALAISGTALEPRATGHASLSNGTVYGEAIRSLSADVAFAAHEAQLRNVVATSAAGRASGALAYNVKTKEFRFDLHARDIALAEVRHLQLERVRPAGVLNLDATGSGTTEIPIVNAHAQVRRLVVNGETVGAIDADAVTHGTDLRLTARSNFENATLNLDGDIRLTRDLPGRMVLRFSGLDIDPLLETYLKGRLTSHSSIDGTLEASGSFREPRLLTVVGTADRFAAELEHIGVQNEGPLRFSVKNQLLRIDSFRLVGQETHFINASGTADFAGARRLNLRLDGRVDMKLLQTFSRDITAYGTTEFGVSVGGSIGRPALQGQMRIINGGVSYVDLPNGLSGINGTLVFTQNRLQVQQLTARSGGGELVLGGFITYDRAIALNLTASGHEIRLRYPPGVSATADADLRLTGTLKNSMLSGDVTVTKFGLNPRFDFASYLAASKQNGPIAPADSPLNGLHLDIHVISTPELQVQTSLARVSGDVDLRLRGTGTHPVVLGRVNIVEGDIFFNGTKYHLERGDVTFTNPVRIEPVLDIEASARVRDYDITLGFHGSTDKLATTYRSDPPLPSADIIALLAMGRTREESATQITSAQSSNAISASASNALLGSALNATVSSRVQKLFGVSRIKIDPQVGGPENNANARVTIEQQVSNKITLTYITNLSQSAQQIIQLEYNIDRNVSILAVRDQNGIVGFDVRIRQRKK